MNRQKNIGLIFKNLGITLAIILSPLLLIAFDNLIWRSFTGQTAHNDNPAFINQTLFNVIAYSCVFAMPLFAFLASKTKKLWLRLTLALTSGLLMLLWVSWCMLMYFCVHGVCL